MSAGKDVQAPSNGGVTQGPAGDAKHIQIVSGAGSDKPMRKITESGMGYSVTSPNPTPSENEALESRP